ncbi:hypothetical protein LCGC14_0610480 [marine sediment metagenome]|uniref:Uncharacterized protein n=1 Tax=marine sediment metagenome TaxID=412755 RepID=A0A0F9RCK2_9ZZZZ
MEPLSKAFNVAVITIANRLHPTGYDVGDPAPSTLQELQDHINTTGRMLVWNGASNKTIYACSETNWAFRAWHDWCHYTYNLKFDKEGERKACEIQKDHIRLIYDPGTQTDLFCDLIEFEIMGQFEYKEVFGNFPEDQMALAFALGIGQATSSYLNKRLRSFAEAKRELTL